MKAFSTLVLGAVLLASQNHAAKAFSPSARSKVLNDLKEMRMTGAGGAASPDYYVEGGESVAYSFLLPISFALLRVVVVVVMMRDYLSMGSIEHFRS
jgi:hypothetical protein